ncbi:PREDICTED: nucleolin-like [Ceratosolen solmsi marchali]|uniref:Nucleolin-like n=1 Tax=Ceratosolen solmsi marchali TaxID=326594 RepID=A0AAJ6YHL5_9HYME|nr:PREDICTED: nucleolin-like [Ceratosolen solmsi marchali]
MKLVVVLALLCCITMDVMTTPLPQSNLKNWTAQLVESRQASVAPVPAVSVDDDDDEDDDVDLDITGEDDDDDDDEEEEDDDDDDYLERFIDEVLGGEDDDDDDDETNAVEPATSAAASAVQPVAASANSPVIPPNVQADLNEELNSAAATVSDVDSSVADETGSYEDDEAPEGQAATAVQDGAIEGAESVSNSVVLQQATSGASLAASAASSATADDDDDDDDDEDVDLDITGDDDDDDDDDDEEEEEDDDESIDDEDDDDDDDIDGLADIASARRAPRELKGKGKKHRSGASAKSAKSPQKPTAPVASKLSAMITAPNADVSTIYVAKYNRFVDTILSRINKILKDKYDPVTVKLTNLNSNNKNKSKNKDKTKNKNKNKKLIRRINKSFVKKNEVVIPENKDNTYDPILNFTDNSEIMKLQELTKASKINSTINNSLQNTTATSELVTRLITNEVSASSSTRGSNSNYGKKKNNKPNSRIKSGNKSKNPNRNISSNRIKASITTTMASMISTKKPRSKARATLYGLSSLKRAGDVSVNLMSDHTTIRTKFNLGPLVLKVEKEFGRSTRKEVRSATATTAEMSGRLSLRVYHGGAATLHSIRVLQPKQMRIESADDHDRTREFVWKRSSHIAHLVSQKLSSATRSMLQPPPAPLTDIL